MNVCLKRNDSPELGGAANRAVFGGNWPPNRGGQSLSLSDDLVRRRAGGLVARQNGQVARSTRQVARRHRGAPLPALFLAAALALGLTPTRSRGAGDETYDIRRDATVRAIQEVMPSVVNIATRNIVRVQDPFANFFNQFWDPYYRQQAPDSEYSLGSGVVIDPAGYVLTNNHVVERADEIGVRFADQTNTYAATVVARDPKSDVALLKLQAPPGTRFHAIKFAREDDLLLGETVLALGNPFGLGGTVTRGILSSKSRQAPKQGQRLYWENWLQTDAPINPGNSGGPLVDLNGNLIGINVAVLNEVNGEPAQGIGFAIPIKLVMRSLSDIFDTDYARSFWFGARVKVGTSPLVVTSVQPDSPAGRAGLKPGDAIRSVNGKAPRSFIDLPNLLAGGAPASLTLPAQGDTAARAAAPETNLNATLAIQRGANERTVTVRLVPVRSVFNARMVRERLGLTLEKIDGGFAITAVEPSSPAGAAGLQPGMLVRAVDGDRPPKDVTDLAKLLYNKAPGEPVWFNIQMAERTGSFTIVRSGNVKLVPRRAEI